MKKILLAISHPDEWNQLLPFNAYIKTIKDGYDHVVGVIPYKGYIVLTEVDEIITVKDGELFSYPSILDCLSSRRSELFLDICVNYCIEKYGSENITIKSWQNTKYDVGIVDEFKYLPIEYYKSSFLYSKKFFDFELIIKPTKAVFDKTEEKYQHIFEHNSFILLTRNFNNKATIHNTINSLPLLGETVNYLTENGIKIINIGFPPQSYDIKNNYLEINDDLTQDELISLFYLSKGVIMAADAGGFVTHYGSNVDFYILNEEWSVSNKSVSISLIESKKTNQTKSLINLGKEEILKVLSTHGRTQNKQFSEPKILNII